MLYILTAYATGFIMFSVLSWMNESYDENGSSSDVAIIAMLSAVWPMMLIGFVIATCLERSSRGAQKP